MATALYCGFSDSRYAEPSSSFYSQLTHAWNICLRLLSASWAINDLDYPQPPYNPALWTIPIEFAQSLLLFVAILGLSRCVTRIRLLLLAGISAFCFYNGELYTVEFLGGMFIAEVTILQDGPLASPSASPATLPNYTVKEKAKAECGCTIKEKLIQAFWVANIVSGLFIASWTNRHVEELWGLRFLNAHTPEPYEGQRVWFCLGAFQIVTAFTQLKYLQSIFTTPGAIYLGNISYALYLTHNLCLRILEPRVVPWLDDVFGKATLWERQLSWLVGLVMFLPIVIFVADLFWRVVDTPSVKFARWLEGKCVVGKVS
jgi:peptidoglycan/LPS O-acetylase OafA/YrhL